MNRLPVSDLPRTSHSPSRAFTMMEVLVVVTVILVIAAIAFPAYKAFQMKGYKQVALDNMRALTGAVSTYAGQNDTNLPMEDSKGTDSWDNLNKPDAANAWYNALPRVLGKKTAGDFAASPESFYTKENILFLPGANYPEKKKFASPLFAIAFNTKLQRKDPSGKKVATRLDKIAAPSKTVVLLEQGVVNENRTLAVQTKKDYDGAPKGSAKSFVGRYSGEGVLGFLDGHAELVPVKDVLTETGNFPHPQTAIIWTQTAEENPNKDDSLPKKAPKP